MIQVKQLKDWRMSCDVGEVKERLENELYFSYVTGSSLTSHGDAQKCDLPGEASSSRHT